MSLRQSLDGLSVEDLDEAHGFVGWQRCACAGHFGGGEVDGLDDGGVL